MPSHQHFLFQVQCVRSPPLLLETLTWTLLDLSYVDTKGKTTGTVWKCVCTGTREEPGFPPTGPPALVSFSLPAEWQFLPLTGTVLCYLRRGLLLPEQHVVALPPDPLLISEASPRVQGSPSWSFYVELPIKSMLLSGMVAHDYHLSIWESGARGLRV